MSLERRSSGRSDELFVAPPLSNSALRSATLSMRIRSYCFALVLLACGHDPRPVIPCGPEPDFIVSISAEDGSLARDTVVRVYYGGGDSEHPEEFRIDADTPHFVLFCDVTDSAGNVIDAGVPGAGGEGGATSESSEPVEGIRCRMWTDGSAQLEVESSLHPTQRLNLTPKKNECIVTTEFLLKRGDAGM
jgi:hypothetical protein